MQNWLKLYKDSSGAPRAEAMAPNEVVGWYLEQDAPRSSAAEVERLISICDDIERGNVQCWETTGNAHLIVIERDTVSIENLYAEPPAKTSLPVAEFRAALAGWRDLISGT